MSDKAAGWGLPSSRSVPKASRVPRLPDPLEGKSKCSSKSTEACGATALSLLTEGGPTWGGLRRERPELGWSWQRNESWELIDPHLPWSLSCLLTPRPALPLAYIHMCLLHRLEDRDALPRMWPETYHGHRLPAAEGRAQEPWPRRRTTWVPTLTLPLRCCVTGQLHLLSVPQFPSV